MATIGNSLANSANTRTINQQHRGIRITSFPSDATINTITGRLRQSAGSGTAWQAFIFDSAGTLLFSSAVRTDIGSSYADVAFTFTGATVAAGSDRFYTINSNCDGASTAGLIQYVDGAQPYDGQASGTGETVNPGSDATFGAADSTRDISISIDYTVTAPPDVTDVDTDESITGTQTFNITGTSFGASQGASHVRAYDPGGTLYQTLSINTWSDTVINATMSVGATPTGIRYGVGSIRVTTSAGNDSLATTFTAPSGKSYVNLSGTLASSGDRITAAGDLAAGDQLEISNVVGTGMTIADVVVNADASFNVTDGVVSFDVRDHNVVDGWGAIGTQTIDVDGPPEITTVALTDATYGVAYSEFLAATVDGTPQWTLNDALPAGLFLDVDTGEIYGTPTSVGTVSAIEFVCTDQFGSDTASLDLEVLPSIPVITTVVLATGYIGSSYSQTLAATGSPGTWDITAGALPAGLSLNADSGAITGTPTTEETASFTVRKTNAAGNDTQALSIEINVPGVLTYLLSSSLSRALRRRRRSQKLVWEQD